MKEVICTIKYTPGLYMKEVLCTNNGTRSVHMAKKCCVQIMAPGLYMKDLVICTWHQVCIMCTPGLYMKEVICTNNGTRSVYERSAVYN